MRGLPDLRHQDAALLRRGLRGPFLIRNREVRERLLGLGVVEPDRELRERTRLQAFRLTALGRRALAGR